MEFLDDDMITEITPADILKFKSLEIIYLCKLFI